MGLGMHSTLLFHSVASSGSVKFSRTKDSMGIDLVPHLLDILLNRGVIIEGDLARVQFDQTRNQSFVPKNRGSSFL